MNDKLNDTNIETIDSIDNDKEEQEEQEEISHAKTTTVCKCNWTTIR